MSEAMDSYTQNKTIYVQLLQEGTTVFRPTQGVPLGGDRFKLLPTNDYDPEDEIWEFVPGTIVRCELQRLNGDVILVAVREA